jgi:hypothetical protein
MRLIAACLLAVAPAAAAIAQDDLVSRIANDPSAPQVNGAKAKLVDDAGVQGGKALRVTVAKKGQNNWDSVVESPITKPVKAGDKLVLTFEARLEKGDGGMTTATIPYSAVQLKAAPYTGVVSGPVTLGPEWKLHRIEGKADKDYPADALKATIQIGNAKQTIDFGPVVVLNMGQ